MIRVLLGFVSSALRKAATVPVHAWHFSCSNQLAVSALGEQQVLCSTQIMPIESFEGKMVEEAYMNNDISDDILAQMGIALPPQELPRDEKEILDTLRNMPTLKGLSEGDFKGILPLSKIKRFKAGDEIIKEGQFDNWIFFIMSGRFAITKKGETIGVLKECGDIFGEMCIIDGSPRSASIVALEDSVCLAMDASYIDRLESRAKIYFQCILYHIFSQILVERLRKMNEDLIRTRDENAFLKEEVRGMQSRG